jgi:hypothetical protein
VEVRLVGDAGNRPTSRQETKPVAKFILTYRYPTDYQALADSESIEAWASFLREIGPNVVDPGWPVFEQATIVGTAGSATKLAGYSVVDVENAETAAALAKRCPTLLKGGGVEVGALAQLPDEHPAETLRAGLDRK